MAGLPPMAIPQQTLPEPERLQVHPEARPSPDSVRRQNLALPALPSCANRLVLRGQPEALARPGAEGEAQVSVSRHLV